MAQTRGAAALLLAGAISLTCAPAFALPSQVSSPSPPTPAAPAAPAVAVASGVAVPDFATQAWLLADLDSGDILASLNPHEKLRPASTQKLLTALTVVPRLDPDQLYRADKGDEVAEGNRVVLYAGLTYKVSDLLHAALLPSANDAAMALAKANGGEAQTVAQMNEEAARLGATDTTVVNPSGLDADGQFTSAHDLAAIGKAAFENPAIASYLKLRAVDFPGKANPDGSRVIYPIYNHNTMLRSGFQGALGGKSGFTSLARRTMVAAAERDQRRLVVALLNIQGNTYRTAEQLLNWGFAHADQLTPIGTLPTPSAPAPTFSTNVVPLSGTSSSPQANSAAEQGAGSAVMTEDIAAAPPDPTRSGGAAGAGVSGLLSVLTVVAAGVAVARARVFWRVHQTRARVPARTYPRPTPRRVVTNQRESRDYARSDADLVDARGR